MEWLEQLNKAIDYIEDNLEDNIDYEELAKIAYCSSFHFQRMFSYMTGVPLSEYIRRRRMSKAALELQNSDIKIIDLALKYGYDSPTSFNRAFQSIHGISPSLARSKGVLLKAFYRINFKITIKGDVEMNYRIEEKKPIRIVGFKRHFDMNVEDSFRKVPLFWQEIYKNGKDSILCKLMNKEPYGIIGASTCMNGKDFDYYIAVASDKPIEEGTDEYVIPETLWAIFECIGPMPNAIQELQKRVVTEWLPSSGYEYGDAPDLEIYSQGDITSKDYKSEIWLPIVKKKI